MLVLCWHYTILFSASDEYLGTQGLLTRHVSDEFSSAKQGSTHWPKISIIDFDYFWMFFESLAEMKIWAIEMIIYLLR